MAAWVCGECSAVYAVDAPVCPQCGGNEPRGDWEPAPAPPMAAKTAPSATTPPGGADGAQKE